MDLPEHGYALSRRDIELFLDDYDSWVRDANDEDYDQEDRDEFQSEVDSVDSRRVQELRAFINESDADYFINMDNWDEYAKDAFNEFFLHKIPEEARKYINYSKWADDYLMDYSEFVYDGKSYYGHD